MAAFEPPPTYAEVVLVEEATGKGRFNPIWLKWFVDLASLLPGGSAVLGTVTSVAESFTGGLISVGGSPITTTGTLALTVAGTSGGIPYFSSGTTWASSAALTNHALVLGGGAAAAPSTPVGLGTNVTVLHGNAAGNPTWAVVTPADAAGNTSGSGNFVLVTGATTSALTNTGAFTEARRKAVWQYTNWSPADVVGAETAPTTTAAATQTAADYITSIGMTGDTLTITFAKTGDYTVDLDLYAVGDAVASTNFYFRHILGGSATRYWTPTGMFNVLGLTASFSGSRSVRINVTATTTQTLTVRLFFSVTSAGTAGNYVASAAISATYEGV